MPAAYTRSLDDAVSSSASSAAAAWAAVDGIRPRIEALEGALTGLPARVTEVERVNAAQQAQIADLLNRVAALEDGVPPDPSSDVAITTDATAGTATFSGSAVTTDATAGTFTINSSRVTTDAATGTFTATA